MFIKCTMVHPIGFSVVLVVFVALSWFLLVVWSAVWR